MIEIIIGIILWLAIGAYTAYRTLVYGFFSTKQTLNSSDLFVLLIIFPICGLLSFIASFISGPKFTMGYNFKRYKNRFYKEGRIKELLDED